LKPVRRKYIELNNFVWRVGVKAKLIFETQSIEQKNYWLILLVLWLLFGDGNIELFVFLFGDWGTVDVRLRFPWTVFGASKMKYLVS